MAKSKWLEALEFKANKLGVAPEELNERQMKALEESTVGGSDCIDPIAVDAVARGTGFPWAEEHLKTCLGCRTLVEIARQDIEKEKP